jgi:hypothetical protein
MVLLEVCNENGTKYLWKLFTELSAPEPVIIHSKLFSPAIVAHQQYRSIDYFQHAANSMGVYNTQIENRINQMAPHTHTHTHTHRRQTHYLKRSPKRRPHKRQLRGTGKLKTPSSIYFQPSVCTCVRQCTYVTVGFLELVFFRPHCLFHLSDECALFPLEMNLHLVTFS